MFDKFCRDKFVEPGPSPSATLPNQFDAGRRTSVSAECWTQACTPYACGTALRFPQKSNSVASVTFKSDIFSTKDSNGHSNHSPVASAGTDGADRRTTSPLNTHASHAAAPEADMSPFKSGWAENEHTDQAFASSPTHNFPPKKRTPESLAARERAEASLRSMIFFEDLNQDSMDQVLDSMQEYNCGAGVNVITQGDEGNELFVLDEGKVEFFVNGEPKGTATDGATFGELALSYNSPRAATVKAVVPCKMHTLDRSTLKRITVAKHSDKRIHSQQVLAQIDVFADLPASSQSRIADALHPSTYKQGDTVISQGDSSNDFFSIDEGTVEIISDGKPVGTQGKGSYFGELALIYDIPRAATVRVTSKRSKVEVSSARGFEQLIGADLVNESRRRDPRGSAARSASPN